MIGYVFISSGAITTRRPDLYPARQDQIDNLRAAFDATGENRRQVLLEKARYVTNLTSLPKLSKALSFAIANNDRVVIDHFGRLFLACPASERGNLLKELFAFRHVFYELQHDGRPLASYAKEELKALIDVRSRINFRLEPRTVSTLSPSTLERHTRNARTASQAARKRHADRIAFAIQDLAMEMTASHAKPTLQAIADEATHRGIATSRGNPWSSSSVHRALKRRLVKPEKPVSNI